LRQQERKKELSRTKIADRGTITKILGDHIEDRVAIAETAFNQKRVKSSGASKGYVANKKNDASGSPFLAIRRVYYHITQFGRTGIIDADLKEYFTSIPHGDLVKCISRRIADKQILQVIKRWLIVPIMEESSNGNIIVTTQAKDTRRGLAQGSPISPLFSNCYFRRFILAWKSLGYQSKFDARIVNYADDYVICCRPNKATSANEAMRQIISRIGLEVNHAKTQVVDLRDKGHFDFLGYSIGSFVNKDGGYYYGTRPSRKSLKKIIQKIHDEISRHWLLSTAEIRVKVINLVLRGWCGYFNQGPVVPIYKIVRSYTERRLRRWLAQKHKN
jgi:RNA-directed DNA polymerase